MVNSSTVPVVCSMNGYPVLCVAEAGVVYCIAVCVCDTSAVFLAKVDKQINDDISK